LEAQPAQETSAVNLILRSFFPSSKSMTQKLRKIALNINRFKGDADLRGIVTFINEAAAPRFKICKLCNNYFTKCTVWRTLGADKPISGNNMSIFKNHIKQHRARLDMTQEDLAQRVGVRRQTILSIEKGKYVPSALLAFQIARELGMKVDELFELEEGEEQP
jgi:putative transcriptional regulator